MFTAPAPKTHPMQTRGRSLVRQAAPLTPRVSASPSATNPLGIPINTGPSKNVFVETDLPRIGGFTKAHSKAARDKTYEYEKIKLGTARLDDPKIDRAVGHRLSYFSTRKQWVNALNGHGLKLKDSVEDLHTTARDEAGRVGKPEARRLTTANRKLLAAYEAFKDEQGKSVPSRDTHLALAKRGIRAHANHFLNTRSTTEHRQVNIPVGERTHPMQIPGVRDFTPGSHYALRQGEPVASRRSASGNERIVTQNVGGLGMTIQEFEALGYKNPVKRLGLF